MSDIFFGDIDQANKMSFSEYANLAKKTAGNVNDRYLSLGLIGEVGEVVDAIKKIYRDCTNGKTLKESLLMRKPRLEEEIGDIMWYNAMLHLDCITDADYIFFSNQVDLDMAVDSVITLANEVATIAMHPNRKNFLNVTSLIVEVCQHMNVDLEKVMRDNIKKLKERYPEGFELGKK